MLSYWSDDKMVLFSNAFSQMRKFKFRLKFLEAQWAISHPWLCCRAGVKAMMTSSNGNIFRVTGPLCGEFTGPGEFPAQRPVTRSFDVFFDLRLNKRLSKQPWGWWFETPSWSLWCHCNALPEPMGTQFNSSHICAPRSCPSKYCTMLTYNSVWSGNTSAILNHNTHFWNAQDIYPRYEFKNY